MQKLTVTLAVAALALTSPANAQSAQQTLDNRYDRALAAGYKALFLCSATANAETNGATRTPEQIHEWELTGIYPKLDPIIRELEYDIVRRPSGQVSHVSVQWDESMPGRVAAFFGPESGCAILPIGAAEDWSNPDRSIAFEPQGEAEPDAVEQMLDPALRSALDAQFSAAFDGTYGEGSRTTAVAVLQGNKAAEHYADGFDAKTPQRTWSVAKSIAATFVGLAVQSGEYEVSEQVALSYWRSAGAGDPRNELTIDHMLRMASGRYTDTPGNRTDPLYWGGATVDERATNWPILHKPGTVYRYANNDTLMAIKAIERYMEYYGASDFFEKIGMKHTVAETDWLGGYVLSSQVWTTARDLVKLGQLHLNNGMWEGERLLPENWVEYVSDPSGPQPDRTYGYGAGWWTFNRPEGNSFEGIPDDAFVARGNRGQYLVVVPSRDVVIVRRGEDMVGTRFDVAAFTRDILSALD